MALQKGNRTYYDPTHGVQWRGNLLPFNTFYAIMSLCLFFVLALIFKLCYTHYRFEIRRAGIKQEEAKKKYERAMAYLVRMGNGTARGILKASETTADDTDGSEIRKSVSLREDSEVSSALRVQFSEESSHL